MAAKAETLKMETYLPDDAAVQAEADQAINEVLDSIIFEKKPSEQIKEPATLEDMLAEGREFRKRGTTFCAVPPCIRELKAIIALVQSRDEAKMKGMSEDVVTSLALEIGRRLFWIKENRILRTPTEDELSGCFTYLNLELEIMNALTANMLELDPKKGESLNPTGETSSVESANDLEVTPSNESETN